MKDRICNLRMKTDVDMPWSSFGEPPVKGRFSVAAEEEGKQRQPEISEKMCQILDHDEEQR